VIHSNRSLRGSVRAPISFAALATAALAAVVLAPSPAEAQILYDTTTYTGGAPSSSAQAISIFDGLAATTGSYGCKAVTTLNGVNNQNQFGSGSNIAYHESAVFTVAPGQLGLWSFRWGVDFGLGGTLLLDGVELQSRWTDMWWGGAFTDPTQYLAGSANVAAGTHIIEVFGFEVCCDGSGNAQFLPPMSATWQDINTTNLTMAPTTCGSPALLLTGSAAPSPVLDGTQLTYTFFYESTGTVTAAGATLSTAVPANTTFVSASNGGTNTSGTVTWTLGALGVGGSGSVTLTVQVVAPLPDGTSLTDTASLSATGATTATATTKVTVSNALLSLTSASAPNPVAAGAQLTVTLGYANTGSGAAAAATITDLIPANTTFVSASNGGTYDATSHQVTFSLGALAMGAAGTGSVSYIVRVATPLGNATALTDMASFSATNNSAVTATSTANVSSAPSLTFTDAPAPSPVAADSVLIYTFSYANSGSDAAAGVTITEALPANVTFQTASASGAYASVGNQVTWTIGSIAAGASGAVTVTVLVASPLASGTTLTDAASLAASNATTLMANSTVTATSSPLLTLTETGAPNPIAAGAQLVYTLAYGNAGTDTAAAAAIVAPLPTNTTFVSATGGGTYDSGANQVTFSLGSVAAGINGSVTFTVTVAAPLANGTSLTASATMSATSVSSALAMATTTVDSAPTLSLTNTGTPNPLLAGSQLTYTLAFINNGTDAAHGAALSDLLPAGTSFISASNGGSFVAGTNTVSWTLGDLAASGSGSVTLVVLVDGNAAAGMLSDTATLSASNGGAAITATAMTMVSSAAMPDAGTDASPGTAGTGGGSTGTGGSTTGAGGTGTTTGSGGTGGTAAAGTGGTTTTGIGGAGGSSTGTGGTTVTGGAGGSSATGTGGAGGSSATGTGGAGGHAAGGTTGAGAGGAGGHGTAGAGGATGGTAGESNPSSSGCDCAVGANASPTSLLGLGLVVGILLVSRRRKPRR
jgi:uncharacterized repeat protein (TIGR01451 family)/MYXO-CTERM domain-containing protein